MFSSGEYTNAYANPYTEYTHLNNYYKGSQFGPKLPPTVPSMAYPTILEQGNPHGYDTLTHGSNGADYYNVEHAYGSSCQPKYYVAKCPENKFLRPFVPNGSVSPSPVPTACPVRNQPIVEGFSQPTTTPIPSSLVEQLKHLKVLFFYDGSGKCPYSKNAMKVYSEQLGGVPLDSVFASLKDIRQFNNKQLLTDLEGTATPFFYSQVTYRSVTGFVPSLMTLVQGLERNHVIKEHYHPDQKDSIASKVKDLNMTVYVMRGCGFCDKLKQLLSQHKVHNLVEYVDASDPNRREEMRHIRGFPHYKSKKTGKSSTGYPGSIEKFIHSVA